MILTPEVRALLKRMDADDAIDKAVELALEAAAKVALNGPFIRTDGDYPYMSDECKAMAVSLHARILALKDSK